jgi:hypothetical protein
LKSLLDLKYYVEIPLPGESTLAMSVEGALAAAAAAERAVRAPSCSDATVANRCVGISGGRYRSRGRTRRPPISLYTLVPRAGSYAYAVGVWDLSSFKDHSVSRRAKP